MTLDVCMHGSLRRSCDICDLEAEVKQLRASLEAAESVIRALDVSIAHPDMGGQHQARAAERPRLTSEQWMAVAKAVGPVTVEETAGLYDGPDSVEWLREQRAAPTEEQP